MCIRDSAYLENQLSEEHKLRKSAERKIKSLQDKLDYANQERFGDRRQRIKSKAKTVDSDRNKEKPFFQKNNGKNPAVTQPWVFLGFGTANSYYQKIITCLMAASSPVTLNW